MLTTENMRKFVGGQMEVQNSGEGYLYRGETRIIEVEGTVLKVTFVWLATGEGFPSEPNRWVRSEPKDYAASLELYQVLEQTETDRLVLHSSIVGETIVFFPPGGSTLDKTKVEDR